MNKTDSLDAVVFWMEMSVVRTLIGNPILYVTNWPISNLINFGFVDVWKTLEKHLWNKEKYCVLYKSIRIYTEILLIDCATSHSDHSLI